MHDGADWPLDPLRSFPAPVSLQRPGGRPGARPVFLHGLWRSGSTWLWSRFRAIEGTLCFYEPLHHGLAKLTPARIARDTPDRIDANRHPALARPYFDEFAPLIERRGVRGYRESLAYRRFVLDPDEPHPVLQRYISSLLDHAAGQDRQAVLGFNRTGLRTGWLSARFDAFNIHIDRDPMAIWASYRAEAAKGNFAYFAAWLCVLERNAAHQLFAPLMDRLKLAPPSVSLRRAKDRRRRTIQALAEDEGYLLTYYIWLACRTHAEQSCDLVIDTRMAASPQYRRRASERIAEATGLNVDLEGLRSSEPRLSLAPGVRSRVERAARALFSAEALLGVARPSSTWAQAPDGRRSAYA